MNASALDDSLRRQAERALQIGDFATSARLYDQFLPAMSPASGTGEADTLAERVQYALALYGLADIRPARPSFGTSCSDSSCSWGWAIPTL